MLSFYITFPFWTCLRLPFGFGLSLWKSGMLPLEITLMLTLCFWFPLIQTIFCFSEILFGSFHWYHLYKFFGINVNQVFSQNLYLIIRLDKSNYRKFSFCFWTFVLVFHIQFWWFFLKVFSFSSSRYIHRKLIKYKTLW